MTLDEARASVGADVVRYWENRPVEHGVITGIGTKRIPLVYVRFEGRKNSRGIDPRLIELVESPEEWFNRTGHCYTCGQPGEFCLCRKPCRCAALHEVGSGLTEDALDQFAAPAAVDLNQAELFT